MLSYILCCVELFLPALMDVFLQARKKKIILAVLGLVILGKLLVITPIMHFVIDLFFSHPYRSYSESSEQLAAGSK